MEENAQYNTDMNFTPHKLELRDVYVNTSMMRLGLRDKVGFHVLIARFFSTVEEEVGTLVFMHCYALLYVPLLLLDWFLFLLTD